VRLGSIIFKNYSHVRVSQISNNNLAVKYAAAYRKHKFFHALYLCLNSETEIKKITLFYQILSKVI
jgi:hypothetical protein